MHSIQLCASRFVVSLCSLLDSQYVVVGIYISNGMRRFNFQIRLSSSNDALTVTAASVLVGVLVDVALIMSKIIVRFLLLA